MRIKLLFAIAVCGVAFLPSSAIAQSGPCPAGTEAALQFTGLPASIELGPNHIFSAESASSDWDVVDDAVHLSMSLTSNANVFAEFDSDWTVDDFFLQLDVTDGPARVTMSWEQESYDVDEPCAYSISKIVGGYKRYRAVANCDLATASSRPRSIIIACGDGNFQLHKLRWQGWNTNRATAHGTVQYNDCKPYCAAGHFRTNRSRITLSRPRGGEGEPYVYTRLTYTFRGHTIQMKLRGSYWVE